MLISVLNLLGLSDRFFIIFGMITCWSVVLFSTILTVRDSTLMWTFRTEVLC